MNGLDIAGAVVLDAMPVRTFALDDAAAALTAGRDDPGLDDAGVEVLAAAGIVELARVEEGEEARIRAQFDTNVFGLFALTRAVLPVMRAASARATSRWKTS